MGGWITTQHCPLALKLEQQIFRAWCLLSTLAKIYGFGKVRKLLLHLHKDAIISFSSPQLQYSFVLSIVGTAYRKLYAAW